MRGGHGCVVCAMFALSHTSAGQELDSVPSRQELHLRSDPECVDCCVGCGHCVEACHAGQCWPRGWLRQCSDVFTKGAVQAADWCHAVQVLHRAACHHQHDTLWRWWCVLISQDTNVRVRGCCPEGRGGDVGQHGGTTGQHCVVCGWLKGIREARGLHAAWLGAGAVHDVTLLRCAPVTVTGTYATAPKYQL